MASIGLTKEIINHFNIFKYRHAGPSGQKSVFIVEIDSTEYALKIIKVADERTLREIDILKKYDSHRGLPKIVKVEKFETETILLEEYIEGDDLSNLLDNYFGDEKKTLKLIYDISIILKPIWEDRYVHRDLKPQNIRIKSNGLPVVLDFGIARSLNDETITAAGTQPYTWCYASPEQISGNKDLISYRTDFFCLGIMAYKLFYGNLPFGDNRTSVEECFNQKLASLSFENGVLPNFCSNVLKYNTSERPRKIETYLKLLQQ
jgi:serine/threonine-protein kinase